MAIEYLGNKRGLLDFVIDPIVRLPGIRTVVDLFCGTAAVGVGLNRAGLRVVANDHLELCATLAEAALLPAPPPLFAGLRTSIPQADTLDAYAAVLAALNALPGKPGFFTETYSPSSAMHGHTRQYLTEANASKVDAIRSQIDEWNGALTRVEQAILLRDLVRAVSAVSNTAGTYGSYLKTWKARAVEPLELLPSTEVQTVDGGHEVYCRDAEEAVASLSDGADVVYLDPPYTKRQYAAYYHLLETLVTGDQPTVTGSTGLPPWQAKSSDFCYRRKAQLALERMVEQIQAPHVFLSYNDDGHITHEGILDVLCERGKVKWWERDTARYRSNSIKHKGPVVRERLYHLAVS